jgi:hypothetical protein
MPAAVEAEVTLAVAEQQQEELVAAVLEAVMIEVEQTLQHFQAVAVEEVDKQMVL